MEVEAPVDPPADAADDADAPRPVGVTVDQVVALLIVLVGLRFGLEPLHDNSFFTHLATGRLILDDGAIPRSDPYSFTAFGEPWVVQSWGASVIYAGVESLVGLAGVRAVVAACCAAIALLTWRLTSAAGSLVGRLAIAAPVLAMGSSLWVERPLIFSLLFLLAVLFALEGRLAPSWMLPIMFVWVNVHGSFPLGLVAIGAFGLGRLLDRQRPETELRVGLWAVAGTLLGGVLSPLGWRLLLFPLELLDRRESFEQIVEWKSPTWEGWDERVFALQLVLAVAVVLWRGRTWRNIVPIVVFGGLSLQSTRNIVHASLVMVPAMAVSLRGLGTIDGSLSLPVLRPVRATLGALMALVAVIGFTGPDVNLNDYPVASAAWMRDEGLLDLDDRVVHRDFVGNYLTVKYGPDDVRVYVDDRVDMYPVPVIADYTTLIDPDGDYAAVLERARATAVLWDKDSDFGDWLEDPTNGWTIVHDDETWMVAVPRV